MSEREIRCLADPHALCEAAADEFVTASRLAIEARGVFRVALAGGSTPCRLHRILTESPHREKVEWDRIDFFFGDERTVHSDHSDSNYRMARDTLLTELGIDPARAHRMQAEQTNLDQAARYYEEEIASAFEVDRGDPPPAFDLILLGMGADGHTASLFPGTAALLERERWVVGNEVPQMSCSRMTFTFPLINHADRVIFLIPGASKAPALAEVLEGDEDINQFPSQGVRPGYERLLILIDDAAGEQLKPETANCKSIEAS